MIENLPIPRNILLIRLSATGDVILASALTPALRRTYPNARLVWLTDDINTGLLIHHPAVDRVIVFQRAYFRQLFRERRYLALARGIKQLIDMLREEDFDWAIDLQGLLKSGVWSRLSGARIRIGLGSREGSQLWMHHVISRDTEIDRIGVEYWLLAHALKLDAGGFPMDVRVPEIVQSRMDAALAKRGCASPYAVICPFTTRPQKHWPPQRWRELSTELIERRHLPVVLLGGPGDTGRAKEITPPVEGFFDLTGTTALIEAAAVIRNANLLIGVDTGLTHLGIAMKTPTLALFGSTRPYLNTGSSHAKVLYQPMDCSPCRKRPSCGGDFGCMKAHTVDRVMAEAALLMDGFDDDTA
ncbi:MAG: glycosyltransferase family 9 protein [Methylococcaceae bacterium]|nr:glycosyltransferase family 9 protein [Methylococcaceae bacterium]